MQMVFEKGRINCANIFYPQIFWIVMNACLWDIAWILIFTVLFYASHAVLTFISCNWKSRFEFQNGHSDSVMNHRKYFRTPSNAFVTFFSKETIAEFTTEGRSPSRTMKKSGVNVQRRVFCSKIRNSLQKVLKIFQNATE